MTSPDLDAPARVSCLTAVKSPFGSARSCVPVLLILSFAAVGTAPCLAQGPQDQAQDQTQNQKDQSVAEAARQERARKETLQKKSKHVYTADDLKRDHILTPEDRAQIEARKNQQPSAPTNTQQPEDALDAAASRDRRSPDRRQDVVDGAAVAQDADAAVAQDANTVSPSTNSANVPLGDVARRLRKEKQSQQLQRSAEFHLPFADASVLASPKAPAQPLVSPGVTVPPTVVNPAPRVVAPLRPFVKRSPFERPRVLPPPAITSPRAIVPAPLVPRTLPSPPTAAVAPSRSVSGKYIMIIVKPGDTLWKFAASRLGDGHRWQELLALNPDLRDPNLIQAGTQLLLPASVAPPPAPMKYTVRHGDTLWSIAQAQLHHGSSWSCIAQANPDLRDANFIHEGHVLLIPSFCKP